MTNRNKALLLGSAAFATVAGIALAQDAGIQSVIGNVFLQNTTPGIAQVGHATLTGTFRAGQVNVTQASAITIPVIGNNLAPGAGTSIGGSFSSAQQSGIALRGTATATVGEATGVVGISRASEGIGVSGTGRFGVVGTTNANGVFGAGGNFTANTSNGIGVQVLSTNGSAGLSVQNVSSGEVPSIICSANSSSHTGPALKVFKAGAGFGGDFSTVGQGATGIRGFSKALVGGGTGLWGESSAADNGTGVLGVAPDAGSSIGVHGVGESPTGFGVFSIGNTGATGTKSFVIDHPLDPERRYLKHYSAEGPEPRNVYQGTVVTGGDGFAWVRLPDYYESINRDPLVQLTVVDGSDDFVQVKVASDVSQGRFQVRTSKGGVRVNWRVDAVRNDGWVRLNGAESEPAKPQMFQGTYLQPKVYGKPESKAQWKRPNEGQRSPRP